MRQAMMTNSLRMDRAELHRMEAYLLWETLMAVLTLRVEECLLQEAPCHLRERLTEEHHRMETCLLQMAVWTRTQQAAHSKALQALTHR